MKRVVNRHLGDAEPPSMKSSKNIKEIKRPLKQSRSEDNLLDRSNKNTPQRKASTPTHEHSALSISPDISCILTNHVKPGLGKDINKEKHQRTKLFKKTSTVPAKDDDIQGTLDFEYTQYINALFKSKLAKASASNIDDELANVQRRIAENEKILHHTTERLKNVKFNKEIDLLHSLHNSNFGKALETLDKSNCEEYLSALEQSQNQLRVKNVEVPQGGADQLMTIISDTLAAFEKLKSDRDVETPKALAEIKEANKTTVNALSRCKENLSTVENLLLTRATMEISARNTVL